MPAAPAPTRPGRIQAAVPVPALSGHRARARVGILLGLHGSRPHGYPGRGASNASRRPGVQIAVPTRPFGPRRRARACVSRLGQAEERRASSRPGQGAEPMRASRPGQRAAVHGLHRRARHRDGIKTEDALFSIGSRAYRCGDGKKLSGMSADRRQNCPAKVLPAVF
jgi:hypothetical protein